MVDTYLDAYSQILSIRKEVLNGVKFHQPAFHAPRATILEKELRSALDECKPEINESCRSLLLFLSSLKTHQHCTDEEARLVDCSND
jgi:hypothetical protein